MKSNPNNVKILNANGKTVRYGGTIWKIRSFSINGNLLADAEPFKGSVNGSGRVGLFCHEGKAIRNLIEAGLVS